MAGNVTTTCRKSALLTASQSQVVAISPGGSLLRHSPPLVSVAARSPIGGYVSVVTSAVRWCDWRFYRRLFVASREREIRRKRKFQGQSQAGLITDNAEQLVLLEKPEKEWLHQLRPHRREIYLISAKLALALIFSISYLKFCFTVQHHHIPIGRSETVGLGLPFLHCKQYHSQAGTSPFWPH
jgi:hypothetical protein